MSVVTNCIIAFSLVENEDKKLDEINLFFRKEKYEGFISIDDISLPTGWYGGDKMFEVFLAIGAFNHLDPFGLIQHIKSIEFVLPECVQLMLCRQESDKFRVINIFV